MEPPSVYLDNSSVVIIKTLTLWTHLHIPHCLRLSYCRNLATPVRLQQQQQTHVRDNMMSCPFVFVRHDGVKRTLQPPYNGPYRILKHSDEYYTLDICGHQKFVVLDRLKPTYIDDTASPNSSSTFCQLTASSLP